MGCIYGHRCKITDKWYIGQSKYSSLDINKRWQDGRGYGPKTRFGQAIKKYGWKNFEHVILEECDNSLLNEKEIFWISFYNSYYSGYNCTYGGKNIPEDFCYKVSVYCYQTKKTYSSIMEASIQTNFPYNKIQRQILTGHRLENDILFFSLENQKNEQIPNVYKIPYTLHGNKNLICIEENKVYNSIIECATEKNINPQNLGHACKTHNSLKGLHFAFLEEYDETWKPAEPYNTLRRKQSSSLKKEVYCLQTNSFYDSASECSNKLGIPVRSISRCAKKDGDLIETHGYNFCYKEDWYEGWQPRAKKSTSYICSNETKERMQKNNRFSKKVRCIETNQIFNSAKEACRITGINDGSIRNCCNHKPHCHTAGGYHWEYVD